MDDRFTRPEVQSLLPAWWRVEHITQLLPEKSQPTQKSVFSDPKPTLSQ
jgi:hypothetical protein